MYNHLPSNAFFFLKKKNVSPITLSSIKKKAKQSKTKQNKKAKN